MLARPHRLTSGRDFAETIRRGQRAGTSALVVHLSSDTDPVGDPHAPEGRPPRVGLVVGKAVGNAVVRNAVKRRLRHVTRGRLGVLPDGARLVVRALPPAATCTSERLGRDLDSSLGRVLGRQR